LQGHHFPHPQQQSAKVFVSGDKEVSANTNILEINAT